MWHKVTPHFALRQARDDAEAEFGERADAVRIAHDALAIAERGEYALQLADIFLFLGSAALRSGDAATTQRSARRARKLAASDHPPRFTYRVAYDEAAALAREPGATALHGDVR
jgi:hypothetical protein